jgi:C1A family cysteine protease
LYASLGRVKQALFQGYPVLIGVNANIDLNIADKKKGVVSWIFKAPNCGESVCGHAMLAVGYQDDPEVEGGGYLIVRNSWGKSWGVGGLAYLTYKWVENSLLDAQAIVKLKVIE